MHGILIHVIKILTHDPCPKVEKFVCLLFVILVFLKNISYSFLHFLPQNYLPLRMGELIMKLSPYPRDATHQYMYLIHVFDLQ